MKKPIADTIHHYLNNIQIVKTENNGIEISSECIFPDSFEGFRGHFPNNPILPAVVQLAAVRSIAEQVLRKKLTTNNINHSKFKAMVKPNQKLFFLLNMKNGINSYHGKFHIHTPNKKTIAKGSFVFCDSN